MTEDSKSCRRSARAATNPVAAETLTVSPPSRGWIRPFRNPLLPLVFPKTLTAHPALLPDPHPPRFDPSKVTGRCWTAYRERSIRSPIIHNPVRQAGSSPGTQTPTVAGEAGVFGGLIPNHLSLAGYLKPRLMQDNAVSRLWRGRHHPRGPGQRGPPHLTAGNALTTGDSSSSPANPPCRDDPKSMLHVNSRNPQTHQ